MRKTSGFTLLELLVVISVMGMMSTIATATFQIIRVESTDVIRVHSVNTIKDGLEIYKNVNGHYPIPGGTNVSNVLFLGIDDTSFFEADFLGSCLEDGSSFGFRTQANCTSGNKIISEIPADPTNPPTNNYAGICTPLDPKPCYSVYRYYPTTDKYDITFYLETATDFAPAGVNKIDQDGLVTPL